MRSGTWYWQGIQRGKDEDSPAGVGYTVRPKGWEKFTPDSM